MAMLDLKLKYGSSNTKGREAVNRAIRAEIPGGNECLDLLCVLDDMTVAARSRGLPNADDLQYALNLVQRQREAFYMIVAKRYGIGE